MTRREPIGTGEVRYLVLLQPEPEGGFTVTCPVLPGLVSYGGTLAETRAMAADAIAGYVACLREDGEPVPPSDVGAW
jgi:predicted RNase H-like HicB family nuclease